MNKLFLTASTLALALVSTGAWAQSADENAVTPTQTLDSSTQQAVIEEQQTGQLLTADLIGVDVMHREHGKIGTLDGLLFDESDQIVGGVISVGGFVGMGAKDVALSWDEFEVRPEEKLVYVDLTQEQLEAAPQFRDRDAIMAEQEAEEAQRNLEAQQDSLQNQGQTGTGDDTY